MPVFSHAIGGMNRSGRGEEKNSLLALVDLDVPLAPGLGGSEHATGTAHVTEGGLTGTVSTTTGDTGDTGNSTTCYSFPSALVFPSRVVSSASNLSCRETRVEGENFGSFPRAVFRRSSSERVDSPFRFLPEVPRFRFPPGSFAPSFHRADSAPPSVGTTDQFPKTQQRSGDRPSR